jgi:hypothetical protein
VQGGRGARFTGETCTDAIEGKYGGIMNGVKRRVLNKALPAR